VSAIAARPNSRLERAVTGALVAPASGRSTSSLAAVLTFISWAAFVVGGFVCLLNFYLSWLSYPLHRLRGLSPESFRSHSGFPLIGSILVVVSLVGLHSQFTVVPIAIGLIAIDTGGIHWFLGAQVYHAWHTRHRGG
jgi:hypothetical protein